MNTDEIKDVVTTVVKEVAETEAMAALKTIGAEQVKALVNQAVDEKVKELEEDSRTSSGWWVKVRNRFEIEILKLSVASITAEVEQQIAQL